MKGRLRPVLVVMVVAAALCAQHPGVMAGNRDRTNPVKAQVRDSVLVIPGGTKAIAAEEFRDRSDFHSVRFAEPVRITTIGNLAFAYNPNLRAIDIPATVRKIGSNVFSRCPALEKVILPSRLQELGSYVFSDCVSLREVTFPANDNLLGEMILYGCENMESMTEPSPVPPPFDCKSQLFDLEEKSIYDRCTLYVPAGSEQTYREAPGWELFRIIKALR